MNVTVGGKTVFHKAVMFPLLVLLFVSLLFSSCGGDATDDTISSVPAYTPGVTPEVPSFTDEELAALGLDETQIGMYHEQGVLNVDTTELASILAGFRVMPPSFIPQDLTRGPYSVAISGAGMPKEVKPKFNNTTVTVIYSSPDDPKIMLALIYMVHNTGLGVGEPTQVGDYQGMKVYQPAAGNGYASLGLVWGEDTRYFSIAAVLGGPLDEETVMKVAASIPIK